jgi:glutathione S-transferase
LSEQSGYAAVVLKLWGRTNSVNVQKALWTLGELGLPFERIDAGMRFGKNREPEFLARNPNGLVPTLDDDGFVLWESNSIVRYLAARYDAGGLWPSDARERARAEKWMDWQLGALGPALGPAFLQLVRTPEAERDAAVIARSVEATRRLLGLVDAALATNAFIAGERLTIGDVPIGALTHRWYALDVDHGSHPRLRRWYERLSERPAYRQHVMLPLS